MAVAFPLSFFQAANVWIGMLLIPYALMIRPMRRFNVFYFVMAIGFGILSVVYGVRMFYFFTIGFTLLTAIEYWKGKASASMLFLLVTMSPFFNQVTGLLGFPIRLHLSDWAGTLLYLGGWDVHVEGNVIVMDDATFSVDQACMGLNMLAISMLMAVFMIAFHQRKTKTTLPLLPMTLIFTTALVLNIAANFLRILMLVMFKVLPTHPLHDAIGIFCLIAYIFMPLHLISKWTIIRFGVKENVPDADSRQLPTMRSWMTYAGAFLILSLGIYINFKRSNETMNHAQVTINTDKLVSSTSHAFTNLKAAEIDGCVTKIYNNNVLLYIKPIPEFFSGEHSPLFCWQGGGYEFKRIKKAVIDDNAIFLGQIVNERQTLYTAWWYSNGEVITIDQFDWRTRMMKGEPSFNLINVTCQSEQELIRNVKDIFQSGIISINHKTL
jgi:exosortase N